MRAKRKRPRPSSPAPHSLISRHPKRPNWRGCPMAEEIANAESGDPAGVALALTGASRAEADAYLRDQRHHMHEQMNQLHLDIWEKKLGVLLRLATLVVGLGFALALGMMVWDAAHSRGLLIEPFSVPPDM